jgi:hypothetical protein
VRAHQQTHKHRDVLAWFARGRQNREIFKLTPVQYMVCVMIFNTLDATANIKALSGMSYDK